MDIFGAAKHEILHLQAERAFGGGDFKDALKFYEQLLNIVLDSSDDKAVAYYHERLGDCYDKIEHHGHKERIEDHKKAAEHYIKAADKYRKMGSYAQAGEIYEKGAKAYEEMDDFKTAAEFYKESAVMFTEIKDYINASYTYQRAAHYFEKDSRYEEAAKIYQSSALCDIKVKDTSSASTSFKRAAISFTKIREWLKAVDAYANTVEIDMLNRQYLDVADTYERMADCYNEVDDRKNAVYYHLKAADARDSNGDKNSAAASYRKVGSIYENAGEFDNAITMFEKSAKTYFSVSSFYQEAASLMSAGRVFGFKGEFETAGDRFVEAAKSSRVANNEPAAVEGFVRGAQMFIKAASGTKDQKKAADLHMKAAVSLSEVKSYDKAADQYNEYAEHMSAANEKALAVEGFKKAAVEYVKGGRIWDAAESYVNYEDYAKAVELYDAFSAGKEKAKDNYGAANAFMEAANCFRRLDKESLMKAHYERAIYYFTKFIDETKNQAASEQEYTLLGDAFRKMGECDKYVGELVHAQQHFTKAEEYYGKTNDSERKNLGKALRLKIDSIKAIDHGYYQQAETMLNECKSILDATAAAGIWKREYTKMLTEGSGEARELVEKIRLKPEVVLDVDRYTFTFVDIPVVLNLNLSNNGSYTMKDVSFLEHLPEQVKLTKLPEPMAEINPGQSRDSTIELTPIKTSVYMLKPIEIYYEDQKGHKYVKASNEVVIEVVERPPTDYKNYFSSLEVFRRYANSQEGNKNWFQAGDGYREMAEIYGRFKTDEHLTSYYTKAVENYRRYVEANRKRESDDKTRIKRLADAMWFVGEGCRNLNLLDESVAAYEESVPLYRRGNLNNLANRSLAFKLKIEGIKAIKSGDYGGADAKLSESLTYFDEVIKSGGYSEDMLQFLKKNEDEVGKMRQTIKSKPDINVSVAYPPVGVVGEALTFRATINNPFDFSIRKVKPNVRLPDGMELVENAKPIDEIPSGTSGTVEFKIKATHEGEFKFSSLDLGYDDSSGKAYMHGSAEVKITVSSAAKEKEGPEVQGSEKPEITLDIDGYSYTFVNLPVILNLRLSNTSKSRIMNVTFLEHLPEHVKLTKIPERIAEIESGGTRGASIELKPGKTGTHMLNPIEVYYEDLRGHRYVKSSNQTTLEAAERPATDYKNYVSAVELFRKYASSQEGNRNWFAAADGWREMAETYSRFKTDETLTEFYSKSVEDYRRYLDGAKELEGSQDKTVLKRLADAHWFTAEGLREMGRFDESLRYYERATTLYNKAQDENLATRSTAMRDKTEAVKQIKSGDYNAAADNITEALRQFIIVLKAGGYDESGLNFLKRHEDEARKMLETIKSKPEIDITVSAPTSATVGETLPFKATINNPLPTPVKRVRPLLKSTEGIEVVESPREVGELKAGANAELEFKMKFTTEGEYSFSPLDVGYTDEGGRAYMRAAPDVKVRVTSREKAQKTSQAPPPPSTSLPKEGADASASPSISLNFSPEFDAQPGVETEITGTLSNDGSVDIVGIRFIGNTTDNMQVLMPPRPIESLPAGQKADVTAIIKAVGKGVYTIKLVEFFYKDKQGRRYFRSSNQVIIKTGEPEEKKSAVRRQEAALAKAATIDMKSDIRSQVGPLKANSVILAISKSENQGPVLTAILDDLINHKRMGGVYINVSSPYEVVTSTLESAGISTGDIHFIDCVSKMAGKGQPGGSENVVFIENPSSLEEVSMYLEKMLSTVKAKQKFILLDSLNSLLIYNSERSVKEFTHFIVNRIKLEGIGGVVTTVEKKEVEDLVKTLVSLCDITLKY